MTNEKDENETDEIDDLEDEIIRSIKIVYKEESLNNVGKITQEGILPNESIPALGECIGLFINVLLRMGYPLYDLATVWNITLSIFQGKDIMDIDSYPKDNQTLSTHFNLPKEENVDDYVEFYVNSFIQELNTGSRDYQKLVFKTFLQDLHKS